MENLLLERPLLMNEEDWKNVMSAHKEIVEVLDRHNIPEGFAVKILIDIERSIDHGKMRTILQAKGAI